MSFDQLVLVIQMSLVLCSFLLLNDPIFLEMSYLFFYYNFITIDSLGYEHDYKSIFEYKVNNIKHWFGRSELFGKNQNYDFIIACRDCNNIFDTIYIDVDRTVKFMSII